MVVTDPIADLLTRIRNALSVRHDTVIVPASRMKKEIVDILVDEGYLKGAELVENEKNHKNIVISLKYGQKYERVINNLRRISKPGLRVYCGHADIPRVLDGLGIAIISTSRGIMTDRKARAEKVGGEVLAYVW